MTFLRTFQPRGIAFLHLRQCAPKRWAIVTEWATDYGCGTRIHRYKSKLRALAALAWQLIRKDYGVGQSRPNPKRRHHEATDRAIRRRRASPRPRPYRSPLD